MAHVETKTRSSVALVALAHSLGLALHVVQHFALLLGHCADVSCGEMLAHAAGLCRLLSGVTRAVSIENAAGEGAAGRQGTERHVPACSVAQHSLPIRA